MKSTQVTADRAVPRVAPVGALSRVRGALSRLYWKLHNDRFDVFVRAVTAADGHFSDPPGYRFRFASKADLARLEPLHTELGPQDVEHGAQRLASGHRLVLGCTADGRDLPVFSMWVNPRCLNVPGQVKRALEPHQEFIYKAFTSPEHRNQRLYQAGMAFVLADLEQRGLSELVGYAHTHKASSRAGLARLGFESVGSYRVLGYGAHSVVRQSALLKRRFPKRLARSGLNWT